MRFLSYVVEAPDEVLMPEHMLALGPGVNVFNVSVEDPSAFEAKLLEAGCRILMHHPLDESEPLPPEVVQETLPEAADILAALRALPQGS